MSRQTDDGHEGYVMHVFADGAYGGSYSAGPLATHSADGAMLPVGQWHERPDAEVVGWRPMCDDLNHHGRECWRGKLWTRVTDPTEHDLTRQRIYSKDAMLTELRVDLLLREWEYHVAPTRGTAEVEFAAGEVAEAQRRLAEAVRSARGQGASWEAIGKAAGMTRQSAHERWAQVIS
ncbi:hypothetical protein [Nocardia sp. NPDC060249]|uniref:hypothetical protein n=1 Tax=Nocardia sp. NPDC060249 TaxID=3347082 RepID=UPI0036540DFE